MAIFQVNLGQSVFTEAKDDGGGGKNWSYKTYNAPVKLSPPTNDHQTVSQSTDLFNHTLPGVFYPCLNH